MQTFPGSQDKLSTQQHTEHSPYPETYIQFWQQLLAGNLKWRWHYIFYVMLVGNALWQTVKMLMAYRHFSIHQNDAQFSEEEL